ncbi:MAG: NAD(P)/FAD-dependent oxidoreductase [Halomonadaceae bacterium]|nr:MAG: NAD(P)/FAD-dependent oxidoreductase [Halomonadaceae bacterium]
MTTEYLDVLIIGAGLSGIGAAYHLQQQSPHKSFALLEARDAIGGTWDLFRYPGIRSDSDMYTLGYSFRPWGERKAIADGNDILNYVRNTAAEADIEQKIRFHHRVTHLNWDSTTATWTVQAQQGAENEASTVKTFQCKFLINCSGYYRYDQGYTPDFPGRDDFQGQVVHPQHWPEDLDYSGKKVVVIGSGATAVTLIPSMTDKAAHVTMLQRSPTYIMALPDVDAIASTLNRLLPAQAAYNTVRWKNITLQTLFYQFCRRFPKAAKKLLLSQLRRRLGADFDIATHFSPDYDPWDQRLCLVPNGDLFRVLRKGQASVVTDHIERFTEKGILLQSGQELEADIIVTATGLNLVAMGGAEITVDNQPRKLPETMSYKGMMLSDVPNMVMIVGYTNASWTLKADLASEYACRLINHMDSKGLDYCVPRADAQVEEEPFLDLNANYVLRALEHLPKQGAKAPWKLYQNYILDLFKLRFGSIQDDAMEFGKAAPKP